MATDEEAEAKRRLRGEVKLGLCLDVILKNASEVVKWPSFIPLYDQLVDGIALNKSTQKFRYNVQTDSNRCFIEPKGLAIDSIDKPQNWKWIIVTDDRNTVIAAELIQISKLDISGKLKAFILSPEIPYVAAFLFLLRKDASGWNVPVKMEVKTPDGKKTERTESLENKPKEEYFEVIAGEFTLPSYGCEYGGEIEFRLYELGEHLKKGLVVKGIVFRSKASDGCSHSKLVP